MIPQPPLRKRPVEGVNYAAIIVDGTIRVSSVGTSGQMEFGVLATLPQISDGLWFVVVTSERNIPQIGQQTLARFAKAAYFEHDSAPPSGELHPDARFYVPWSR